MIPWGEPRDNGICRDIPSSTASHLETLEWGHTGSAQSPKATLALAPGRDSRGQGQAGRKDRMTVMPQRHLQPDPRNVLKS